MNGEVVKLSDLKSGIRWKQKERPSVNHWYRYVGDPLDFWKITKDFHSPKTKITYYKIVEYYNGDILYSGRTLAEIRQIMRENTCRVVI